MYIYIYIYIHIERDISTSMHFLYSASMLILNDQLQDMSFRQYVRVFLFSFRNSSKNTWFCFVKICPKLQPVNSDLKPLREFLNEVHTKTTWLERKSASPRR